MTPERRRPPDAALLAAVLAMLLLPALAALEVTPVGGFRMFTEPVRYRLTLFEERRDGTAYQLPVRALLPHATRDARRVLGGSDAFRLGETQARLVAGRLDALAELACRQDPRRARVHVRIEIQDGAGAPLDDRSLERACE
ncbi:MAG: hypothetical protein SangKO_090790 [Sandaracinaceae bacterium]